MSVVAQPFRAAAIAGLKPCATELKNAVGLVMKTATSGVWLLFVLVNALVAAETMTGIDGHRAEAISHDALRDVLRKHHRRVR